ncbi:peptide chain release factor 1 [Fluviispira multicolorata]|uniref:Peptide chain release factor 1 n=1 Tax=Fluviispira multicolorata TaxID=2654512 RepID=A0A833N2N7_9BACT|nr:peptide chain release factor 1 [Fluviispira multicolorata]KAB8028501.1 peptide chain release factor 1 [Fluviispira multicolorata]
MMLQLAKIERRFLELENLLSRPEIISNNNEFRKLSKERAELEETVRLYREFKKIEEDTKATEELYQESTGEMQDLAFEELKELKNLYSALEKTLSIHLLPKDPNDSKNIFLEIRAGAGGDEASLFAGQLFRAYMRYAERKKWKVEIMSLNENELGGTKEVIALIEGEGVYSILKYESGVHRVQRVPQTEAQGRVHTSTITVAVLPEADDVDVTINENELRIDTYRAGGAGGQHVNRTDSAVRITHIPSGIVVACQDERSQIKNRSKAMKILQAKLLEAAEIEKEKAFSEERRSQVGRGDRSERIRTYNFPQSRVTDHRINHTIHSIDAYMEGEIQEMLDLLRQHYQAEALKLQAEGN